MFFSRWSSKMTLYSAFVVVVVVGLERANNHYQTHVIYAIWNKYFFVAHSVNSSSKYNKRNNYSNYHSNNNNIMTRSSLLLLLVVYI